MNCDLCRGQDDLCPICWPRELRRVPKDCDLCQAHPDGLCAICWRPSKLRRAIEVVIYIGIAVVIAQWIWGFWRIASLDIWK